jgi:hypothetical protein
MFLNWALGLRKAGARVVWLDTVLPERSSRENEIAVRTLRQQLLSFGINDVVVLYRNGDPFLPALEHGCLEKDAVIEADLLLNLGYDLPAELIGSCHRSAFVDLDPGQTQVWIQRGELGIPPHDLYFTYGETVGISDLIPSCGIRWHYTPPAIALDHWPTAFSNNPDSPYTTVTNWWGSWMTLGDATFENSKRIAFLKYVELPRQVSARLEIAAFFGATVHDDHDRAVLRENGWGVRHVLDVSSTPQAFQEYLQMSRGEFSCLLPAYTILQTAWTSERTLNYLASGRPAIIQDTGASRFLPRDQGLLRFRTADEAVRCFETVENDYSHHCAAARKLVEEHFDATTVASRLLERSL